MRTFRSYLPLIFAAGFAAMPPPVLAQFAPCASTGVSEPPPALPAYQQPRAPAPNYQWNPGYWAWDSYGYYWVPGVWVAPPAAGVYWTPGYWRFAAGVGYVWNQGYWGPAVGFYGGINYGYGYFGAGFVGGTWIGNTFAYNTAVTRVNRTVIRNVYSNRTVIRRHIVSHSRVSFNGGHGGVRARPTLAQRAAAHQRRFDATAMQTRHAGKASMHGTIASRGSHAPRSNFRGEGSRSNFHGRGDRSSFHGGSGRWDGGSTHGSAHGGGMHGEGMHGGGGRGHGRP